MSSNLEDMLSFVAESDDATCSIVVKSESDATLVLDAIPSANP